MKISHDVDVAVHDANTTTMDQIRDVRHASNEREKR